MDPNLFHLDLERAGEALIALVLLSFLIERALALLFESRTFIERTEDGDIVMKMRKIPPDDTKDIEKYSKQKKVRGLKETIAFIVSVIVCWAMHFDILSIIFVSSDKTTILGYIVTGAIVAGGSKASIKLFKDVMKFRSSAEEERMQIKQMLTNPKNGG